MALRLKAMNKGQEVHCRRNEIPSYITNPRKHALII
jgi:hypothetical protein